MTRARRRPTPWCRAAAASMAVVATLARAPGAARADGPADEDLPPSPPPDTGVPGPWITYAARPTPSPGETRACSPRAPVCVHAPARTPPATSLAALGAAERAWETLTGALGLPRPDLDDDLAYHLYLVASAPGTSLDLDATYMYSRDVRAAGDRARTFATLDASLHPGCMLDAAVTRAIARAIVMRAAPATSEGTALAQTTYLAELVVPCALAFSAAEVSTFQRMATRAVCDTRAGEEGTAPDDPPGAQGLGADRVQGRLASARYARGGALFWRRLDAAYAARPGALVMATWALASTRTEVGARRWHDEPDAFDVLRESFKGALSTGSTIHDLFLDTAIARAFAGSNDDGLHLRETVTLHDAGRVPIDWDLPWPTKPARFAPRSPVHPSGASYVVIRHAGAPKGARLRAEITWEEHALFRWAFVKLDAAGRELGRVVVPTPPRATEVQMTLAEVDDVDRILLVGTNVGDPAYRFDPDDDVWEPHGWLLTIAAE
ncbi:MAG: hypothetical protein JST00_17460 [Deltaproteobacteria bacterium]|nr:hypothetical protein [Deltaproteobacteria bacterium]